VPSAIAKAEAGPCVAPDWLARFRRTLRARGLPPHRVAQSAALPRIRAAMATRAVVAAAGRRGTWVRKRTGAANAAAGGPVTQAARPRGSGGRGCAPAATRARQCWVSRTRSARGCALCARGALGSRHLMRHIARPLNIAAVAPADTCASPSRARRSFDRCVAAHAPPASASRQRAERGLLWAFYICITWRAHWRVSQLTRCALSTQLLAPRLVASRVWARRRPRRALSPARLRRLATVSTSRLAQSTVAMAAVTTTANTTICCTRL
jgi:hypothetical protein